MNEIDSRDLVEELFSLAYVAGMLEEKLETEFPGQEPGFHEVLFVRDLLIDKSKEYAKVINKRMGKGE